MTLHGPQLHGAIFGFGNENLHLHHLRIQGRAVGGRSHFLDAKRQDP